MKSPLTHALFAGSLCGILLIGYGGWYSVVGAKSAAGAKLENLISVKDGAMGRIASARTSLTEIVGGEAGIQKYLVSETGVVAFITDLEAQGRAQGVTISVLSVSTGGTDMQPTLTFALTVKGTFDAVMRTVGMIEYAPYSLSIASLSLGRDDKSTWHANLDLLVSSIPASDAGVPSSSDASGTDTP